MKDIFVGDFTDDDCRNKIDKIAIENAMRENPECNYIHRDLLKNHNPKVKSVYISRIWICNYYSA